MFRYHNNEIAIPEIVLETFLSEGGCAHILFNVIVILHSAE